MSNRLTRRLRVLAESKDSAGFTRVKAADIVEMTTLGALTRRYVRICIQKEPTAFRRASR
jgi:hypothetical protein